MNIRQILFVLLATSLYGSINANQVESKLQNWKNSDSVFSPKLFKFLLMLPTTKTDDTVTTDNNVHEEIHQIDITDNEVHGNDMVTSTLKDFFNKGGSSKFANIFSKHAEMKSAFKSMISTVEQKKETTLLLKDGRAIGNIKPQNLNQCLMKNKDLGATLYHKNNMVYFVFQDNKFAFTQEEFKPYRVFLYDVCFMVEYIRMHFNDYNKNLVIHHLESAKAIYNSEHKKEFMKFLYNAINVARESTLLAFGKESTSFLISKFVQAAAGALPLWNHNRILEADTGDAEAPTPRFESDFAWSLRICFGILFCFLILYVSFYMYQIEVYRDTLIYAKFISTKKDKKAA